jgi:hypothetical protein
MSVFQIQRVNESVRTTYRELFTIRFVHTGFETSTEKYLSRSIRIEPDKLTKQQFVDRHIDYRFYRDTLVCFIECVPFNPPVEEPKIPFVSITGDLKIRFLVLSSDEFVSKSYVVAAGSTSTYQLSNKVNNTGGGSVFLTSPVENHSPAGDYEAGTIVQDGTTLFAALKTVRGSDGISLSNASFWKPLQAIEQVVSNADLFDNATVIPSSTCLAVIDLYKNGTVNNSYKLFDSGDKLFDPAPVFTIVFKSKN